MNFTNEDNVFLKPNLVVEPLVDNWYAWTHLIFPVTAGLNIRERHLKILNSYIQNPQIHMAAVKNPKMLGGPFIDYPENRVDDIKILKSNTLVDCAFLLDLCQAIDQLNTLLESEARGYSLAELYPKVPSQLRGFIEIFYDLNNYPSYRFYELLVYKSQYYKQSLQSLNMFLIDTDDSRSFVLSTPKLTNEKTLRLNLPFSDKRIDELFELDSTPKPFGEIKSLLNINDKHSDLFSTFFTTQLVKPYNKYTGEGILTRYFGHACILVESKETSILVDPVISYGYESDISRFTYSDLPSTIDYVVFTHNHQDHILFETLLRIRRKIKHLIVPKSSGGSLQDPNLKLMFEHIGFHNVIELGDLETRRIGDCIITGLPFLGEHADLDVRSKLCHLVEFKNGYKILFAADSCNVEPEIYDKIHSIYGDIDIVFLGMECDGAPLSWLYGPLLPHPLERDKDQTRRLAGCNYLQAKALLDIFNPKDVFIYAMGMEPWLKFISSISYTDESRPITESNKVLDYCQSKNIQSERLFGEKVIEY